MKDIGHDRPRRWRLPHAKLAAPRVPATVVARPRLLDQLGHAVAASDVTLVCAPAGYGKTFLLADWVSSTGKADKAWIALDSDDDCAERFLTAVLAAICDCAAVPADCAVRTLTPPREPDAMGFLADLLDAIEVLPGRLHLVLDDVQEVSGAETVHVLTTLIRHQPRNLRLVLSSRSDPPLPLARLRVQGRLNEIRMSHLRFSVAEAGELLRDTGVVLTDDQLRRLVEQTDGWVAGLRLASRSLWKAGDPEAFLADFASSDQAIADFLVGEVLARLPDETRNLLRVLSVGDVVAPQLAATLSGRPDAGGVLAELERESSLVVQVGEEHQWYRIHPLLRSYLRADLHRHSPELVGVLHGVAAKWFAAEGFPLEALHHAEETGNAAALVELLRDLAVGILLRGQADLVLRALAIAGTELVRNDPMLCLYSALAHLELGELAAAESDIARCGVAWPSTPDSDLVALRRLVVSAHALACGRMSDPLDGRPDQIAESAEPAGTHAWIRLDRSVRLIRDNDRAAALRELQVANRLASEQDLDYLVLHNHVALAALSAVAGDYAATERACAQAIAMADENGWQRSPWLAAGYGLLGLARLLHLRPRMALDAATRIANAEQPVVHFLAGVLTGAARFDLGSRLPGLRLLQAARHQAAELHIPHELSAVAAAIEHQCALSVAEFALAREVCEWYVQRCGVTAEAQLMTARTHFARGDLAATDRALREALSGSAPRLVALTEIECRLSEAAVSLHAGRRTHARRALGTALSLAAPHEAIRCFAYADPAVRTLLLDQIGGFGDADAFASRVRRVLADVEGGQANGVLTGREHAVLARLTSPRPLDEVASELLVSVNTVKTHVRAIYAKLGVNNRRAAVVAARELGLT
ncbi:LuxR C-terminal-related transcriptional regulator [Saccharomonospora sp. NPDC046836]|uniref:LuxR C-terminal-related transcriptional regulator n=1 Tax=Saccharomonospora sp. NPDC046836 TaxID=3156921 RepID=UPI00340AE6DA